MKEPKLKFKVKADYPNSPFIVGDILQQVSTVPDGSVGKFIDNKIGWVWIDNPLEYPHLLESLMDEYLTEIKKYTQTLNGYTIDCDYYEKSFNTLEELIEDCTTSGMDPNYEVLLDGKPTGNLLVEFN